MHLQQLKDKQAKQIELTNQLEKSLKLESLDPVAFNKGSFKLQLISSQNKAIKESVKLSDGTRIVKAYKVYSDHKDPIDLLMVAKLKGGKYICK